MSDTPPPPWGQSTQPIQPGASAYPPQPGYLPATAPYGGPPAYAPYAAPIGKVRGTGTCILLTIVTLGFYTWYWYFATHDEMKRHSGQGLGGGVALVLTIFVGFVMPFFTSAEVGNLYERRGQRPPVTAATGLWYLLLGWFFFIGAIVWFVKTNAALNDYWRSVGAQG
jgi:hypothetical protein